MMKVKKEEGRREVLKMSWNTLLIGGRVGKGGTTLRAKEASARSLNLKYVYANYFSRSDGR